MEAAATPFVLTREGGGALVGARWLSLAEHGPAVHAEVRAPRFLDVGLRRV